MLSFRDNPMGEVIRKTYTSLFLREKTMTGVDLAKVMVTDCVIAVNISEGIPDTSALIVTILYAKDGFTLVREDLAIRDLEGREAPKVADFWTALNSIDEHISQMCQMVASLKDKISVLDPNVSVEILGIGKPTDDDPLLDLHGSKANN